MTSQNEWDVFISHASEDKEKFVKPLAIILARAGIKVWYDEFTLKAGDVFDRTNGYHFDHEKRPTYHCEINQ